MKITDKSGISTRTNILLLGIAMIIVCFFGIMNQEAVEQCPTKSPGQINDWEPYTISSFFNTVNYGGYILEYTVCRRKLDEQPVPPV
jgi:K+-transporting ATPase A subunit